MAVHGLDKASSLLAGESGFPDPLGIGSTASLGLATFGELVCPLLVAIGLKTRLATLPVVVTMLVAAFVQHAGDPWGERELAALYAAAFATLALTGSGAYSLDALLRSRALQRADA